jgi:hypothetical protein
MLKDLAEKDVEHVHLYDADTWVSVSNHGTWKVQVSFPIRDKVEYDLSKAVLSLFLDPKVAHVLGEALTAMPYKEDAE